MKNLLLGRALVPLAMVLAVASLTPLGGTRAAGLEPETVLYSFCSQQSCTDGEYPYAAVVMDAAGHLYGYHGRGGHLSRWHRVRADAQRRQDQVDALGVA